MSDPCVTLDMTHGKEAAMTGTTLAPRPAPTVTCDGCGQAVRRVYTTAQRQVVLDAEPTEDGIYRIDRHGRAERRSLVLMYQERRAGLHTLAHDVHECRPVPWYDR
jgi:hypothetical protein